MAAAGISKALAGTSEISSEVIRAVWDAIGQTMDAVVRECNSIAGEPLWSLAEQGGRLTVLSLLNRSSALELWLQAEEGALRCNFSTPCRHECWVFHILRDGAGLRRAARTYNVPDAVNAILDALVCARSSERIYSV